MSTQAKQSTLVTLFSLLRKFAYWIAVLAGCLVVVFMLLWVSGTFHRKVPIETTSGNLQKLPTAVAIHEVKLLNLPRYETAVGTIQAVREASVASKILARVEEVNVIAGQKVAAGESLVRLQNEDLAARLGQAESNRSGAEARQVQARAEFDRAASLLAGRAVSQSEYQAREADLRSASAELERSKQAVEEAKVQLSYATIVAPFDGIIVDKQVKPGDTAVPGQVLFSLYDPTHMQLVAQVRESLALTLKPGQRIMAGLASLGYECEATISEVVPQANSSTHSFAVKVVGPCPPGVYSGMFGRLKLLIGAEDVIVIPKSAIKRVGQLTMVLVAKNSLGELRNVQLGRDIDGRLQVLAGLRAGESVVEDIASMEVKL
ncbi:MAG: efflux RND transporter periplasmic adaptor subunit [Pirellulales bacterium]